ncbi:MAG: tetratricopeptide repeat protein [Candidatus Acidiferrales bacterium]
MHFYADSGKPDGIIHSYETAVRLSPYSAQYWADLGAAYDWAGRPNDALRAFERARELFPNSPDINWRLANFYIRAGKITEGLHSLQKVLLGDSMERRPIFVIATSATRDTKAIVDEVLPLRANIFFDFLNFLIEAHNIDAVEQVWARLLELNLPFDFRQAFPYLDALIQHRDSEHLAQAWSTLAERFPAQIRPYVSNPELITNGSFELEILNGGLDWRVLPVEGAIVSVDSLDSLDGVRSLRIEFDGTHNLDYGHVLQFVPVKPNTRYRFSSYMRAKGITTDSGARFQIFDAYDMGKLFLSTENLVGTSGWSPRQVEFKTGPDTRLLVVRLARSLSHKLDNRVAGTVWIDRVSLDAKE